MISYVYIYIYYIVHAVAKVIVHIEVKSRHVEILLHILRIRFQKMTVYLLPMSHT